MRLKKTNFATTYIRKQIEEVYELDKKILELDNNNVTENVESIKEYLLEKLTGSKSNSEIIIKNIQEENNEIFDQLNNYLEDSNKGKFIH